MTRTATVSLLCVLGCSANSLDGSMSELTPLSFNQVTVKLAQKQLVISYFASSDGGGSSLPFQLAVDQPDGGFTANSRLEVSGLPPDGGIGDAGVADGGDGGAPPNDGGVLVFAVATRSVPQDTRPFSAIDRGHIDLNQLPVVGQTASGDFFVVFAYQKDGSLGSGRTVFGNFSAKVSQ
jgi:hypothetical protein